MRLLRNGREDNGSEPEALMGSAVGPNERLFASGAPGPETSHVCPPRGLRSRTSRRKKCGKDRWSRAIVGPLETDAGPWVIVINEGSDVKESARRFAEANTAFDTWFKQRVEDLTGVDLSAAPLGPPTTPIYEWSQDEPTRMKFAPFQG